VESTRTLQYTPLRISDSSFIPLITRSALVHSLNGKRNNSWHISTPSSEDKFHSLSPKSTSASLVVNTCTCNKWRCTRYTYMYYYVNFPILWSHSGILLSIHTPSIEEPQHNLTHNVYKPCIALSSTWYQIFNAGSQLCAITLTGSGNGGGYVRH
jgi:hypothetical protein